jgi:virulence-associated protein VapD
MENEKVKRKAINFDLYTDKLKEHYPARGENYKKAYLDLRNILENNGFEHCQGSGYRSIKKIRYNDILHIIRNVKTELP